MELEVTFLDLPHLFAGDFPHQLNIFILLNFCFSGSLEMLIIPAAIYLKVMPRDSKMYMHAAVLGVFGIAVMVAVTAVTIISFI